MAPQYIARGLNVSDRYAAERVRAIRFVEGMETSHWHVNIGHPRIKVLRDIFWVQTRTGAMQIFDGQWVVLLEEAGLSIMDDKDFTSTFEPLSDYE